MKKLLLSMALLAGAGVTQPASANHYHFWECLRSKPVKFEGTITDAVVATKELSILTQQVVNANLADTLASNGNFTVYAPVDSAFAAIPPDILNALTSDPEGLLKSVLLYHVSSGSYDPRRYFLTYTIPTVNGQSVFFNMMKGYPRVNNARVDCQPVETFNGIVYLIDTVLLPQFTVEKESMSAGMNKQPMSLCATCKY